MPEETENQTDEEKNDEEQSQNNAGKPVVLACDTNNGNDQQCEDTVAQVLEQAGYPVTKLPIGPNEYATYSYSEDAKGKNGVYLMAASLLSFLDAAEAGFDYNVLGIRGDVTGWSEEEWKQKKIPKDHHGDCTMPECDTYEGKTYPELNEIYKGKCIAVTGETCEKLAQNILAALGGQGVGGQSTGGGGAQIKDKTFEKCIRRICAATDSVFIVENNAAVLFPYTDWLAFTLREKIQTIKPNEIDPKVFAMEYNNDGFYNKVTIAWGGTTLPERFPDNELMHKAYVNRQKQKQEQKTQTVTNKNGTTQTMSTDTDGTNLLSEQYDILVKKYGELEKRIESPAPDLETAQYLVNALLIQYVRDFNNTCQCRSIADRKYIGGTFYIVTNPFTYEQEMLYLNGYTIRTQKGQPIYFDLDFRYGPESAEELLDYQFYTGGAAAGGGTTGDSSTESAIWSHAANFCHFWSCPEMREAESDTNDPQVAEDYVNKKEKEGKKRFCLSCYGMSAWLYYQFNNKANIPCRVIFGGGHKVVELYKNNEWYKPIEEYRQLDEGFRYNEECKGNAEVTLQPPGGPK